MKTRIFSTLALVATALMSVVCTSCEEPEEAITPAFPEKVVANVEAGELYTLTIEPNMDWKVKVPTEAAAYFCIMEGMSSRYSVYGSAGKHEIKIKVADQEEFDHSRTCQVTMEMGGQTEVIAELTRSSKERTIAIYQAEWNADEEAFNSDADGNWIYDQSQALTTLEYRIYNGNPVQRLAVDANFRWSLADIPEWMILNTTSGKEGRTELFIRVDDQKRPLEDTNYTLRFCITTADTNGDGIVDSDDVMTVASLGTTMEGCEDVCEVSLAGTVNFNRKGLFYSGITASYQESVTGSITSAVGSQIFLLAEVKDGYSADCPWLTMTVGEYDSNASDVGLWSRDITLKATENKGKARRAILVAFARTQAGNITSANDLLDGTTFKAEYADNVVCTIEQEECANANEPIMAYDEAFMLAMTSRLDLLAADSWPMTQWSQIEKGYQLTYNSVYSGDDIVFNVPFESYEIYGYDGVSKYTDLDNCWIALEPSDQSEEIEDGYMVRMRLGLENPNGGTYTNPLAGPEGQNEATFVFYDIMGEAYALLYCVMDPTFYPITGAEGSVQFADPIAAAQAGARLEEITTDSDEFDKEYPKSLQYKLYCNKRYTNFSLKTSFEYMWCYAYSSSVSAYYNDATKQTDVEISAEEDFSAFISFYNSMAADDIALQLRIIYTAE